MSCQNQTARSRARRTVSRGRKSGFTLVELLVVISIIGMLMALLLPQIQAARETARGNTCRNNMRGLGTALFNTSVRTGGYPGYINALQTQNGKVYMDPTTGGTTMNPVSWAVMILPDIDRGPLFDQWRMDITKAMANISFMNPRNVYIEQFLCPSDPQSSKTGTPISFVVNSGQPDLAPTSATSTMPRDWAPSGMFFDNYSAHSLVQPTTTNRAQMVYMRDELCRDPKSRTIMLTENIDALNYVISSTDNYAVPGAEIGLGAIWSTYGNVSSTLNTPPTVDPALSSTATAISLNGSTSGTSATATNVTNINDNLRINVDAGRGDGTYYFCRPSSRHPQSVNVSFVEVNVQSLRDNISYFVFAKMMASDDEGLKQPGQTVLMSQTDKAMAYYQLSEGDINP